MGKSTFFLIRPWAAAVSLVTVIAAGCSSSSPKPTTPAPAVQTPPPAAQPKRDTSARDLLQQAAAKPAASFPGEDWQLLFNGKTLAGWRETDFAGRGEVECLSGMLVLNMGDPFTGVNWTNDFPTMNYEVAIEAMRVNGSDFFCGLTVPVGTNFCSLIVGGWGGSLVGISSLDHADASENETTKYVNFEPGRWYRIRLRITERRIEAWIDDDKLINVDTRDRQISLRPGEIELSKPFGLASWQTTSALRQVKMRRVFNPAGPLRPEKN